MYIGPAVTVRPAWVLEPWPATRDDAASACGEAWVSRSSDVAGGVARVQRGGKCECSGRACDKRPRELEVSTTSSTLVMVPSITAVPAGLAWIIMLVLSA